MPQEREILLESPDADAGDSGRSAPSALAALLRFPLNLFSSVRFGIVLLALLFIYSSVGSSGVPRSPFIWQPETWVSVRRLRFFELTEFEWFNWWPFTLLIALICITLVVTTLRRIRLSVLNLGVWFIHSGIIVLSLGSVWYFGTKVEGDAPVNRRQITISVPGLPSTTLTAAPGAMTHVGDGAIAWTFRIFDIDPAWELLTGDAKGSRAYSVRVAVRPADPAAQPFLRQLIAGRPDLTEDIIFTNDPQQPMQRAKKVQGDDKPLVDESLQLALEYAPQPYFFVADSHAVYLREKGSPNWVQRPIHGLPRYNDYIASAADVFIAPGSPAPEPDPLTNITIPAVEPGDPLPGVTFSASRFLNYAMLQTRIESWPDSPFDPTAVVRLRSEEGNESEFELSANDPQMALAADGNLQMIWVRSQQDIDALMAPAVIRFTVPQIADAAQETPPDAAPEAASDETSSTADVEEDAGLPPSSFAISPADTQPAAAPAPAPATTGPAATAPETPLPPPLIIERQITRTAAQDPSTPFEPIEGTDYSFRVLGLQIGMQLGESTSSVAVIELKSPQRTCRRWVFDDPSLNRDFTTGPATDPEHDQPIELDRGIESCVVLPSRPAPITLLAGPGEGDLSVLLNLADGIPRLHPAHPGGLVPIANGVTLEVIHFVTHPVRITKPFIVPRTQRDRGVEDRLCMIQLDIPSQPDGSPHDVQSLWLPFHWFAFDSADQVLRRFPFRPSELTLTMPDGSSRTIEFMFSRVRLPLPAPVALETFVVDSHVGGYTGESTSISDWTSLITFNSAAGQWTEPVSVSVNKPKEFNGYWFFQSQWDPPDAARFEGDTSSNGLNYTVLGVGNRNGVNVMLTGTCIAVFGMIYAWYIKPIIRRRRQLAVMASLDELKAAAGARRSGGMSSRDRHQDGNGMTSNGDGRDGGDDDRGPSGPADLLLSEREP